MATKTMDRIRKDSKSLPMLMSFLEELFLFALRGRDRYGLEILKAVQEESKGQIKVRFGTLYPTLHRLEEIGVVESFWGDDRPGEPRGARRRYYRITGLGEKVLRETQQMRENVTSWGPVEETS